MKNRLYIQHGDVLLVWVKYMVKYFHMYHVFDAW